MCVSCHLCSIMDLLIWGTEGLGLYSGEWIMKASIIRPVNAAIFSGSTGLSTSSCTLHQLKTGLQWLNKHLSQSKWPGGDTAWQWELGRAGFISSERWEGQDLSLLCELALLPKLGLLWEQEGQSGAGFIEGAVLHSCCLGIREPSVISHN